ncbi:hypothetical protein P9B03_17775 [Metasolibacillus meyeri]|uniref:Uncharacterized protein n=1 Tax=Metasolibacillus meyeri TaxID=1071052 RepID=A0AAW9NRW0_9BACL|nr:hypothetical protein [Metasolibacillus meyeri]MEC1180347.1 hypothetical protein [Metasolibacillus meyeri]
MTNAKTVPEKKAVAKKAGTKATHKFTKKQLVSSQKYQHRQDALHALLDANTMYSYEQVETILKQFDKGGK